MAPFLAAADTGASGQERRCSQLCSVAGGNPHQGCHDQERKTAAATTTAVKPIISIIAGSPRLLHGRKKNKSESAIITPMGGATLPHIEARALSGVVEHWTHIADRLGDGMESPSDLGHGRGLSSDDGGQCFGDRLSFICPLSTEEALGQRA
jgi:hypothetical protein